MSKEIVPFGGEIFCDPFPHVTKDAELWIALLMETYYIDRYLYGILLYLRGVGAILAPTGSDKVPYKIVPIIDKDRAWASMEEWEKEKKWLVPHTDALIEGMRKVYDSEISMPGLYNRQKT